MKEIFFTLFVLFICSQFSSHAAISHFSSDTKTEVTNTSTPYPEIIELIQIVSADKEALRMVQFQTKFDNQLTGFYAPVGKKIIVKVEELVASTDKRAPRIVIGTPRRGSDTVTEIELSTGENVIQPTAHKGGMIYFRYISNDDQPKGKVRISFVAGSEHVRVPHFVKGVTTDAEFSSMMTQYQTADVMFSTEDAVVVVSREAALKYSINNDKEGWLAAIDKILLVEDQISGLSNTDSNSLHHRLAKGIRHLFVEANTGYMFATNQVTGYNGDAALTRLLTKNTIETNNWGVAHELGHQHQQGAYKPGNLTETTVNIYTLAVQRAFQGDGYIRSSEDIWNKLKADYFSLPVAQRNYNDEMLKPITGDINSSRLLLFDQLQIVFGDEYYHRLHRIAREEKVMGGSDEDRLGYLVLKSCQLSGYDLRDYFKAWGINVTSYHQNIIDKAITNAGLKKPSCNDELHLTTPYSKPACVPLPLIGISTSKPEGENRPDDATASIEKYCDYSTKSGVFTDPRDNKQYAYKKYGEYDWFMENLNWDGYDGKNESTRGTVGLYGTDDPDGKFYGRMYPTNAVSSSTSWCPDGWSTPSQSQWDMLMTNISSLYGVDKNNIANCLKCGGDQDDQADGLWTRGAGEVNATKAAQVGFNALPAGVFNKDANTYDSADKVGLKASFLLPGTAWFHEVLSAGSNTVSYLNRNSRHHASVRCVRKSSTTSAELNGRGDTYAYYNKTRECIMIVAKHPILNVCITDMNGRTVFQYNENNAALRNKAIDCTGWVNGVYIISLKSGPEVTISKTVKY